MTMLQSNNDKGVVLQEAPIVSFGNRRESDHERYAQIRYVGRRIDEPTTIQRNWKVWVNNISSNDEQTLKNNLTNAFEQSVDKLQKLCTYKLKKKQRQQMEE